MVFDFAAFGSRVTLKRRSKRAFWRTNEVKSLSPVNLAQPLHLMETRGFEFVESEEFLDMNRVSWQRWDPFREIHREMGRLFETMEPLPAWRVAQQFPVMNVYETGDRYILTVPIPGVNPEEIDLSITGETLTLRGERKRVDGVSEESYRRQERPFGRWTRTVTLPDRLEGTQVSASYANGVLTVSLPKAESTRPRQIAVAAQG